MTPEDIQNIEHTLNIKLPPSYISVVENYPCPDNSDICGHGLFNDPLTAIKQNLQHRQYGWFGLKWPETFFVIGDSGCGDTYFLVIGRDERVYFANHEGGPSYEDDLEECVSSGSVREHVEEEMELALEFEEEIKRRALLRANKKWWQFWL